MVEIEAVRLRGFLPYNSHHKSRVRTSIVGVLPIFPLLGTAFPIKSRLFLWPPHIEDIGGSTTYKVCDVSGEVEEREMFFSDPPGDERRRTWIRAV